MIGKRWWSAFVRFHFISYKCTCIAHTYTRLQLLIYAKRNETLSQSKINEKIDWKKLDAIQMYWLVGVDVVVGVMVNKLKRVWMASSSFYIERAHVRTYHLNHLATQNVYVWHHNKVTIFGIDQWIYDPTIDIYIYIYIFSRSNYMFLICCSFYIYTYMNPRKK